MFPIKFSALIINYSFSVSNMVKITGTSEELPTSFFKVIINLLKPTGYVMHQHV